MSEVPLYHRWCTVPYVVSNRNWCIQTGCRQKLPFKPKIVVKPSTGLRCPVLRREGKAGKLSAGCSWTLSCSLLACFVPEVTARVRSSSLKCGEGSCQAKRLTAKRGRDLFPAALVQHRGELLCMLRPPIDCFVFVPEVTVK